MQLKYLLVLLLLGMGIYIVHTPRDLVEPKIQELSSFPSHVGQWVAVGDTIFDKPSLDVLRPTDYLMRTYVNPQGKRLSIYIGYHNGGPNSGPIHSPKNCLPGSGWFLEKSRELQLQVDNETINLVRADFRKDGNETTFYYWYQIRGQSITQDISMKFAEFTGTFFEQRKDATFIRIDMINTGFEKDETLVHDFLKSAFPLLKSHLPS